MSSPGDSLASMLEVEKTGAGEFTASLEDFWGASLGCDALARATLAASQTCPGLELHSLHAAFIAPAPPSTPLALRVERLADGGDLARRRVLVSEGARPLCDVSLLFGAPRAGLGYQSASLETDLADPDTLPSTAERAKAEGWAEYANGPIEFRRDGPAWPWPEPSPRQVSLHREWIRPRRPLSHDREAQTAALVFAADFYSHWTASDRLGARFNPGVFAALDCAVWVHRRVPWDGWWLLRASSEVGHAGRMLTRREIYARDGNLLASAVLHGFYGGE